MGKDPAFLFYPGDYLGGTMGYTLEQHGAYLMLLIYQFNNDSFTEEQAINIVGKNWEIVKKKFEKKDGVFFNKRLKNEKEKRKKYSESRSKNRKISKLNKKTYDNHMKNICKSYDKHMENENENRNKDINEDKNINIIYPFASDAFRDAWEKWKAYKKEQHRFRYKGIISEQAALNALTDMGEDRAIAAIVHSMAQGYKGIFEKMGVKGKPNAPKNAYGRVELTEEAIAKQLSWRFD